jgi:hypothetical protein
LVVAVLELEHFQLLQQQTVLILFFTPQHQLVAAGGKVEVVDRVAVLAEAQEQEVLEQLVKVIMAVLDQAELTHTHLAAGAVLAVLVATGLAQFLATAALVQLLALQVHPLPVLVVAVAQVTTHKVTLRLELAAPVAVEMVFPMMQMAATEVLI